MKSPQTLSFISQISTLSESTGSVIEARGARCSKLTDTTVQNSQFNKLRLTLTKEFHHIAEPVSSKNSECQLHKWCLKGHVPDHVARVKAKLCYCPTCNVIFCLSCYSPFHKMSDLHTIKSNVIRSGNDQYDNLGFFS